MAVVKRPGSSMAGAGGNGGNGGRRTSLLPQPRGREGGGGGGRESRAASGRESRGGRESPAVVGARVAMRESSRVSSGSGAGDGKPKWRG